MIFQCLLRRDDVHSYSFIDSVCVVGTQFLENTAVGDSRIYYFRLVCVIRYGFETV